ncbi:glycerol-3-phosphate dehydrogenase [Zhengella mangrovi]|uniref:Glycerol-3-phosphate dehydrogenase n=1 Tax=Zhengella mangrovi TaxID=1982044 RepID=A0A2G1QTY9_9HYPH|nr:2-dehydropantoate 2-reductase N-terminal domain-containing protein [Zhengella mangrovi]PHP68930.1 glycerol-3-phosphate dehydrogenase [Zhengella mangrovi]
MTRVVIIGAGVMGTAFATPLSDNGMTVDLVGTHLDRDLVAAMQESRVHPRLRARIGQTVTPLQDSELAAALERPADLVVVGVSTPGIGWAIDRLAESMRGTAPVILLTKGIAETADRVEILPDLVRRELAARGVAHGPVGAVGGPCIAGELAARRQTSAIIGFDDKALAAGWAAAMSTGYYHLAHTDDLTGLEICAALKNFYAIGVSVPSGRLAGDPAVNDAGLNNETASLFNQAVTELSRIVAVSGGDPATAFGLAGLGDLHVTTQAGRNSRLGKLLGEGLSYRAAMAGPLKGETVEGTLVAASLKAPLGALAGSGGLPASRVPLANAIVAAVTQDSPLQVDLAAYHLN